MAIMAKKSLDDSDILKTGGGALNNVQKAIIGFCMKDRNINCKNIFDFDKREIDELKKSLEYIKQFVNSEDFGNNSYTTMWLQEAFERNHTKFDVSNESLKKFNKILILNEIKKIEKLLADYAHVFEYSKDLEDSQKFINNVLKEMKKIESEVKSGKKSIEDFDELANMYGCAAGGSKIGYVDFNNFLREGHFKRTSPERYADMCKKVAILRDGLIKRSNELPKSKEGIKLYRYTNVRGILGMLAASGVISNDWLYKQCVKFEKQYKCEIIETFANEDFNKWVAGEIMKLLNKKPVIYDKAFLSTSLSETATSGGFGTTKLIIHGNSVDEGDKKIKTLYGADISKLSGHPGQEEVLLMPNHRLKVLKAKDTTSQKFGRYLFQPSFEIELEAI